MMPALKLPAQPLLRPAAATWSPSWLLRPAAVSCLRRRLLRPAAAFLLHSCWLCLLHSALSMCVTVVLKGRASARLHSATAVAPVPCPGHQGLQADCSRAAPQKHMEGLQHAA